MKEKTKEKKQSELSVLLGYAGSYKGLTFLGLGLSAVAMILGMAPYVCIWLAARDLIDVAPEWTKAADVSKYGWLAFGFAVAGIGYFERNGGSLENAMVNASRSMDEILKSNRDYTYSELGRLMMELKELEV